MTPKCRIEEMRKNHTHLIRHNADRTIIHPVIICIYIEPLPQVLKGQGTVFFEFESAWHILSKQTRREKKILEEGETMAYLLNK